MRSETSTDLYSLARVEHKHRCLIRRMNSIASALPDSLTTRLFEVLGQSKTAHATDSMRFHFQHLFLSTHIAKLHSFRHHSRTKTKSEQERSPKERKKKKHVSPFLFLLFPPLEMMRGFLLWSMFSTHTSTTSSKLSSIRASAFQTCFFSLSLYRASISLIAFLVSLQSRR